MRSQDLDIGILQQLYLSDLVKFLRKSPDLYQAIGFKSAGDVEKRLNGLVHLRNSVAHPVRPLVMSSGEMANVSRHIQQGREVLAWLAQYAETRGDVTIPLQRSASGVVGDQGPARPTDT